MTYSTPPPNLRSLEQRIRNLEPDETGSLRHDLLLERHGREPGRVGAVDDGEVLHDGRDLRSRLRRKGLRPVADVRRGLVHARRYRGAEVRGRHRRDPDRGRLRPGAHQPLRHGPDPGDLRRGHRPVRHRGAHHQLPAAVREPGDSCSDDLRSGRRRRRRRADDRHDGDARLGTRSPSG